MAPYAPLQDEEFGEAYAALPNSGYVDGDLPESEFARSPLLRATEGFLPLDLDPKRLLQNRNIPEYYTEDNIVQCYEQQSTSTKNQNNR